MKIKLACVVILYNPSQEIITKVIKYGCFFEKVILIDNSKEVITELCNSHKIEYIPLRKNMGISHALNRGINRAKELNFDWVILLDQDSIVTADCVNQLCNTIQSNTDNKIAIVSANYEPYEYPPSTGVESINSVITSGTVLSIKAFEAVGNFIDEMFIDAVDYEYCYRLISKGYKILRNNQAIFEHIIGNPTYINGVKCSNYPAFRYYFITRNNLIVSKIYKDKFPESMKLRKSIKKYQKSVQYEKDSLRKQLFILIAKLDYILWLITHKYYCHIKI